MKNTPFDNRLSQDSKNILAKAKGKTLLCWSGSDSKRDMSFSVAGLHFDGFDCILRIREPEAPAGETGDIFRMDVMESDSRTMPSPSGFTMNPDGSKNPCVWCEFAVGKTVRDVLVYIDPAGGGEWKIGGTFVPVDDACGIAFVFGDGCLLFEKGWIGTELWTVSESPGNVPAFQERNPDHLICERL